MPAPIAQSMAESLPDTSPVGMLDLIADTAAAASPADRLPEAGSLPDGFVESPNADNAAADYEELPVDPTSGEEGIGSAQVGQWPPVEVEVGSDGVNGSGEAIRRLVLGKVVIFGFCG